MAAFKVLETQFQKFIKSRTYLDDEYVIMTRKYFLEYIQLVIQEFHDTLIQHMESIKKSIDKRALHKKEYDSWVNERHMQTTKEKVDTSNATDDSLVNTESNGQNQQSRIQAVDQGMMHMLMMQISDLYMMKSQWLRISKPRFASQVDVNNDLPKPVTTHYLPREKESVFAKPHYMISYSRYSSNDMVHNHYLEEAKKKTQESERSSRPSVMCNTPKLGHIGIWVWGWYFTDQ
nr:hypothetical protein [Tanacetum cinerariifolium]